jgi:hypothetical protein
MVPLIGYLSTILFFDEYAINLNLDSLSAVVPTTPIIKIHELFPHLAANDLGQISIISGYVAILF